MYRDPRRATFPLAALGSLAFALTLSACGGVIKFADSTPIRVVVPAVPVEEPKRVEVKADRIQINEKIQFELDKADIKSESHGLLNEIVAVIQQHPEIKKVEIQGHTDADGGDKYNQDLSDRRAKAVQAYLTGHGVEAGRLTSRGYGESKPIADNDTAAGKEQNRRVEFMILEQDGPQGGTQ